MSNFPLKQQKTRGTKFKEHVQDAFVGIALGFFIVFSLAAILGLIGFGGYKLYGSHQNSKINPAARQTVLTSASVANDYLTSVGNLEGFSVSNVQNTLPKTQSPSGVSTAEKPGRDAVPQALYIASISRGGEIDTMSEQGGPGGAVLCAVGGSRIYCVSIRTKKEGVDNRYSVSKSGSSVFSVASDANNSKFASPNAWYE